MPKSKKGKREVQCAGVNVGGVYKGRPCKRTKMLPVDEHSNTVGYWCHGHKDQKGR